MTAHTKPTSYCLEKASIHVEVNCPNDIFENAIRTYGIVAACEWFGHEPDSNFTKETIKLLEERSCRSMTSQNQ